MLMTALVLAIVSTTVEFFTLGKMSFHVRAAAHSIPYATVVSMGLSLGIGTLFTAGGLIAMMGGMMSTVISVVLYRSIEYWNAHQERITKSWESNFVLLKDMWQVVRFACRIITFPIWGYRDIRLWWAKNTPASNINSLKGRSNPS